MTTNISVFDGHNDVLLRLYKSASSDVVSDFLGGEDAGHIDLKKARAGSFVGGLFAMYSPSPGNFASLSKQMTGGQLCGAASASAAHGGGAKIRRR